MKWKYKLYNHLMYVVPINVHCKSEHPFNLVHDIIYTLVYNEMGICVVYPFNLVPINVRHCKAERPFCLVPNIIYTLGGNEKDIVF